MTLRRQKRREIPFQNRQLPQQGLVQTFQEQVRLHKRPSPRLMLQPFRRSLRGAKLGVRPLLLCHIASDGIPYSIISVTAARQGTLCIAFHLIHDFLR